MMEIGSFIELQFSKGQEYYKGSIDIARLNSGRAALWHAFRCTGANTIWLPYYQCDSVRDFFQRKGVNSIKYYHIDQKFNPIDLYALPSDAVLFVNYYGVMSQERMRELSMYYNNVIIDNSQAFFCKPISQALNVYSCRKFIGVPDGAYVIGEGAHRFTEEYPQCFSSDTASFLLKRIEYGCEGEGYKARSLNEHRINSEDVLKMSKLTRTILDGTNYEYIRNKRRENFQLADSLLGKTNALKPLSYYDSETVPMVYPLLVEDDTLLDKLLSAKHFQGHWWSYICDEQPMDSFEHWVSRYMIPITIDQRYDYKDIYYLTKIILQNNG